MDGSQKRCFSTSFDKSHPVVSIYSEDQFEHYNDNPALRSTLGDFEIVSCLSKSSPSSVYVVKANDGNLYAIKMTECLDESEAVQAYHQEMELKKLNHPFICKYKEFFINFNKHQSSIFINIITPYYKAGSLLEFIKGFQDNKEEIPENVVKRIIGGVIEGLVYIYDNGFVHRNVKPTNIYQRGDGVVVIGDLGVSMLMGDAVTHTRKTFEGTVFLAPEIGQQPHDEKSDLYSLGGVLLNMLTTSVMSQSEFCQKLGRIKEYPEELNGVLDLISHKYTKSMINTVQTLLRPKHNTRPIMLEFIKAGYIQECMALVDLQKFEKRSHQEVLKTTISHNLADNRDDVFKVLEYIAETREFESCVAEGLSALADHLRDKEKVHEFVDQIARSMIIAAMWDHLFSKDVQIAGCYVLSNLAVFSNPDDVVYSVDVINIIHKIMAGHEYDPEVQLAATDLILALSTDEKTSRSIVQLGGIQDIVIAMRHSRHNATLNVVCCMALWSLTIDPENLKLASRENAVRDICLALQTHKVSSYVCEAASAALISLLLDDASLDVFIELGCAHSMIMAINLHKKNARLVKNCCKVLATVVESVEECAYEFLSNDKEEGSSPTGILTIMEVYRLHRDNADVVESIVRLLLQLSNFEDLFLDLKTERVTSQLLEMSRIYAENEVIMGPLEQALERLGARPDLSRVS